VASKTPFFTEALSALKSDTFFFAILSSAWLFLTLSFFPFHSLVYFDEQDYILSAQNIRQEGMNAICNSREDGKCEFTVSPNGIGMSTIYSLVYSPDFDRFSAKIAVLNSIFSIFNALWMYVLANKLFRNKAISRASSTLLLFFPYNMMYSTTAMPETASIPFFIFVCYFFLSAVTAASYTVMQYSLFSLLVSQAILSTLRMEYVALFLLVFIGIGIKVISYGGNASKLMKLHSTSFGVKDILLLACAIVLVILTIDYVLFYAAQSIGFSGQGAHPEFHFHLFNGSYFLYYFSGLGLSIASFFFVMYWIQLPSLMHPKRKFLQVIPCTYVCILVGYVLMYSFYNFPHEYRFLMTTSPLYTLFSAAGLVYTFQRLKIISRYPLLPIIVIIPLCILFVFSAVETKQILIARNGENAHFLLFLQNDKIGELSNQGAVFFLRGSQLGQVAHLKNYLNDFFDAQAKVQNGRSIYYIDSPFETIEKSEFNNPDKYTKETIFIDPMLNFGVYKISQPPLPFPT